MGGGVGLGGVKTGRGKKETIFIVRDLFIFDICVCSKTPHPQNNNLLQLAAGLRSLNNQTGYSALQS